MLPLSIVLGFIVGCVAPRDDGPRIVNPEDRRAFYRTGGREYVGRAIHLHVEGAVLRKKPKLVGESKHDPLFLFENRTVPLVIDPHSPYWRQASRHLETTAEFCLHGTVRVPSAEPGGRAHLEVRRIQRAPGKSRAKSH